MNFTVTGRGAAGRYDYRHASALSALDQGLSLLAAGMADVLIVDGCGRARTPAALYQSLFGPASSEPAGAGPAAAAPPLAA
ncbi:hypothetical protein Q8W71_03540 [Methylobacterium sp. NEAU 140]|uniref:hypothetical protein n=1 Tax=Methylobacterium sp. NEAU 140 TaxID=3064945 RepID=UPI002733737F|nr:hypothetical protein [Methylobacterium sp. NEAU 140]MDP4021687.1 hypothetical protein [Methylobacterium sp. NEAU 140]